MTAVAVAVMAALVAGITEPGSASEAPASAAGRPQVGVQFHGTWSDYTDAQRIELLDRMAAAGVEWVRVDIGWQSIEDGGPGKINPWHVATADRIVDAARDRGIQVLATLWATPGWANDGRGPNVAPNDPQDYARIAQWAAAHFKGRVAAWEVWNEPNLDDFWVTEDPVSYAGLLKASYPAFKSGDPQALVVGGAVSLNDDPWLARMYDAGAGGSFDVLSTHPYSQPGDAEPERRDNGTIYLLDHLRAVRRLMVERGDGHKPIWATEFGWTSYGSTPSTPSWARGVDEATQADFLVRALRYLASEHPYVTHAFWYTERNRTSGNARLDNYGLLRHDLTPKPAYHALAQMLAEVPLSLPAPQIAVPVPELKTSEGNVEPQPAPSLATPAEAAPTVEPAPTPAPPKVVHKVVKAKKKAVVRRTTRRSRVVRWRR